MKNIKLCFKVVWRQKKHKRMMGMFSQVHRLGFQFFLLGKLAP